MGKCKLCGSDYHYQTFCRSARKKSAQTRKPIKRIGKYGKQWLLTRETWLKKNPPDECGYYKCHICGDRVYHKAVTLDHIKSRSRHPELRFVLSNLAPAHWDCNQIKGSKDLSQLT